jgi:hypothetical protein
MEARVKKLALQFAGWIALVLFMSGGIFYAGIHVTSHLMAHKPPTLSVYWPNDAAEKRRDEFARKNPNALNPYAWSENIFSGPDGKQVEIGFRSDGVLVWREWKR